MVSKDEGKKRTKDERRVTASDRSRARMLKYLVGAIAIGCAFPILIPALFRLFSVVHPPSWVELSPGDSEQMVDLFFSGSPYVVFCDNRTGDGVPRVVRRTADLAVEIAPKTTLEGEAQDDDEKVDYNNGVVVGRASRISVAIMDCNTPFKSGKNVMQRFRISPPPPQALPPPFFVANGDRPHFLPLDVWSNDASAPAKIMKYARKNAVPSTLQLQTDTALQQCLKRKTCMLYLHSGSAQLFNKRSLRIIKQLQRTYPHTKIATLDVKRYTLDLQKSLPKPNNDAEQWPRLLLFRREAVDDDKDGKDGKDDKGKKSAASSKSTLAVKAYRDDTSDFAAIQQFLNALKLNHYGQQQHNNSTDNAASDDAAADSSSSSSSKSEKKSSKMAILRSAPHMYLGANNFPKKQRQQTKPERETRRETRRESKPEKKSQSSADDLAKQREEEAERMKRRREQMEEEASQYMVYETNDDEQAAQQHDMEEDSDEVVNLDGEQDEL